MARDLNPSTESASQQEEVRPVLFLELQFASETSYVWSGIGPIDWNEETWLGLGQIGEISTIEETAHLKAAGVSMKLSGLSPTLLDKALVGKAEYRRRPINIWLGFSDPSGVAFSEPALVLSGQMDIMSVVVGETLTIELTAENDLIDLQRPRTRRYTPEDQKETYPDDLGFDYVAALQDMTIEWPNG